MRAPLLLLLFAFALVLRSAADDLDEGGFVNLLSSVKSKPPEAAAPELDPKRIINESNSFLKDAEPEMTAEEYAVYEKVAEMLTTNADLAVTMLEAMMTDKEQPSPAFALILGNAYYATNQMAKAEENYRSAVTRYPNFIRAWSNLGVLYYTNGRYADAVPCFAKAIALGNRDPANLGLLGFCLEKDGDTVSAESAYLQAMTGDPLNTDWKEGLLRIYTDGRQYGRAEALVRTLIKIKPEETRFWLSYAGILVSEQRKVEAMVVLEEAAAAGATGPEEESLLGDLYAEENMTTQAIEAYQKVLAADRVLGGQKLLRVANLLISAGRLPEAEQTLAAVTGDVAPEESIPLMQTRADLAMARKQWPEARRQVEALLAIKPLNGHGLLTLGRTYLEEKNTVRAALAFESAYRIPGVAYEASLELANIELMDRHFTKAAQYLERALSIEKTDAVSDYLARVRVLARGETNPSGL
jgi:tetratricopeptide (TPR) repeat protein